MRLCSVASWIEPVLLGLGTVLCPVVSDCESESSSSEDTRWEVALGRGTAACLSCDARAQGSLVTNGSSYIMLSEPNVAKICLGGSKMSSSHGAATVTLSAVRLSVLICAGGTVRPVNGEAVAYIMPPAPDELLLPPPLPPESCGQRAWKCSSLPQVRHFMMSPLRSLGFFLRPCPFPEVCDRCPLPLPLR